MPRLTIKQLQADNKKLLAENRDLRDGWEKDLERHGKEITRMRDRDEDKRMQISGILRVDSHARYVQDRSLENRSGMDNHIDYGHRRRAFSWEEIFFMIGGLNATSRYSMMDEELHNLRREVQELRANAQK